MSLPFITDSVAIQTYAETTDQYGDLTQSQRTVSSSRSAPAAVQLDFSTDDRSDPGRAKRRVTTGRVWLNPGDPITEKNTVLYRGQTFEVQGKPIHKSAPFGDIDHIVVNISLVRG